MMNYHDILRSKNMNRQEALAQLISALVETEADFSCKDGSVTVGALTFHCREGYLAVSMEQATNYFRYKTLYYISADGDRVCIADSHEGVFSMYKVR
jgi:hypothetical protein